MQFIELKDYLLLPFYLLIIYLIAYRIKNTKYPRRSPVSRYYIPALTVKIVGAIGVGLVYQYYYSGGDTTNYFQNGQIVSSFFGEDINKFLELIFKPVNSTLALRDQINWTDSGFGYNESNYFPVRLMAVINLFTFQSYLPSAVILAFLSFMGVWKAYTSFVHMYPALHKEFAISFLFIPSVFFWGSGILKDSIVFAAVCWLFYGCYVLFILRKKIFRSILIVILSISVITIIKPYVGQSFLPSVLFWIFFQYRSKIRIEFFKVMAIPIVLAIIIAGSIFVVSSTSNSNVNTVSHTVVKATTFNTNNKEAGSTIDIGIKENMTYMEILQIAPLATITTLFRPFIFEANNVLMALSAFEASYLIYLFLLVLFKIGAFKVIRSILKNPLISFCLVFSLAFAFAVGFSTSNFGTLVRYKIPCIPFFMSALFILIHDNKVKGKGAVPVFIQKRVIQQRVPERPSPER